MVYPHDFDNWYNELVEMRRDFHMHPETGFKEFRTAKIIKEYLKDLGIKVITDFCENCDTAIIGIIEGELPGPTIGLRADIDALPIQDLKDISVPYHSQNKGVCHACGHDSHTTILLGVARYFAEHRDSVRGVVKFIFQPAEEGPVPGGARLIAESGVLDDVNYMLATHTDPSYPVGSIIVKYDELYASADYFTIDVTGTGCHGAYPHDGCDPIITSTDMIQAFQTIVSREIDPMKPAVISVCSIASDSTLDNKNTIPQNVSFSGTIRTLDNSVRDFIHKRMHSITNTISEAHRCFSHLNIDFMCPALINDKELTDLVHNVAIDTIGSTNVYIKSSADMAYEDFSHFSYKVPSTYFLFGVANNDNCIYPYHHPKFDIDEKSIPVAMSIFINSMFKLWNADK